jgi:predicted amidophosphoribosyltransferase
MKLCPYCQKEMEHAATVCPHCGRDWKTGVSHLQSREPQKVGGSSPWRGLLVAVGIIGFLVYLIVTLIMLQRVMH